MLIVRMLAIGAAPAFVAPAGATGACLQADACRAASVPPVWVRSTLSYVRSLRQRFVAGLPAMARLVPGPGKIHRDGGGVPDCFGSAGSDGAALDPAHDTLSALDAWIERGPSREMIVATQQRAVSRSRPLCAFPAAARDRGGPVNEAASSNCGAGRLAT